MQLKTSQHKLNNNNNQNMHQIQVQNQLDQDNYQYFFKIVLVGNPFVGKSQILSRFTRNYFQEKSQSTIGVECAVKYIQIDGKIVKIQIWDTMGQERFKSVTKSFYKNAVAAILVYSVVDQQSFQDVDTWCQRINQNASQSSIIISLVGNKIDLEEQRVIKFQTGRQLAEKKKMKYYEVSAATGINITSMFHHIAEQIIEMVNKSKSFLRNINPNREQEEYYRNKKGKKLTNQKKGNNKTKNKCC